MLRKLDLATGTTAILDADQLDCSLWGLSFIMSIISNKKLSPTFNLLVLLCCGSVLGVFAKHFLTNAGGVEFF